MTLPIIGITEDSSGGSASADPIFLAYASSVEKAGGQVVRVPYRENLSEIPAILDRVDAMLFTGGADLDPSMYNHPRNPNVQLVDPLRQRFEIALLAQAEGRNLPILGICLGCQLMNVHRGGTLIQFLPEYSRPDPLEHRKLGDVALRHPVRVEAKSILAETVGGTELLVNTYHKQAILELGRGLQVTARASDGVVEAVEDASRSLFMGVQWHPERVNTEPQHLAIFQLLVARARQRQGGG